MPFNARERLGVVDNPRVRFRCPRQDAGAGFFMTPMKGTTLVTFGLESCN
jgi:hypothetical protein